MVFGQVNLTARKKKLLMTLAEAYIREARPISSQYLERFVEASSATIRNELRELEALGFVKQVHPQGGRVPTTYGYRVYVDELISQVKVEPEQVKSLLRLFRRVGRELEELVHSILDRLSLESNYLAFVTIPPPSSISVKSISLIEVDDYEFVIVLVTDSGVTQSRTIKSPTLVKNLLLGLLNERLNNYCRGKKLAEINFSELKQVLRTFAKGLPVICTQVEALLKAALHPKNRVIFTEAYALLAQPEFGEPGKFKRVMQTITDEGSFLEIVDKVKEKGVDAIIGEESGREELDDVSILVSPYETEGKLGLVGPTRLQYQRTIPLVFNVAEALRRALGEEKGGPKR